MTGPLYQFLARQSRGAVGALGVACMLLLGAVDYLTGPEISAAFVYLIPVSLVAWFVGRRSGLAISAASAVVWLLANTLAGEQFSSRIVAGWNTGTRLGFFVVVTLLLSRLRSHLDYAEGLAYTDDLTGIPNSRAFYARVSEAMEGPECRSGSSTLAYLDLDHFKALNDRYGHSTGDTALRVVARTLVEHARPDDLVARLGGDEFAIFFPAAPVPEAVRVLERIRDAVRDEMRRHGWSVTLSIGVTACGPGTVELDELVGRADATMYLAKAAGDSQIRFTDPDRGPTRPA